MTNIFVVKVASRCNLNCSYCYMYNMGDNTYLNQPKFMSEETVHAFAEKLRSYCEYHSLKEVYIAFHGGEPLLIDKEFYSYAVPYLRKVMNDIPIFFTIQTNGTLMDDAWCTLLKNLDIQIGISIDGPREFHDKYRVYHNNKGSFDQVLDGIRKRNEYGIGGVISVINIAIPPAELYCLYKDLKSLRINILLPDGHFENLPEGFEHFSDIDSTPYGDWLIALYDLWKSDMDNRPNITFFSNIIGALLGYEKGDELIGKRKNGAICIETDGAIEVVDPLRICGNGFTKNHLNVNTNEIIDIEQLPLFDLFYNSHDMLSSKCQNCVLQDVCGGGYLPHRYSQVNGFDNRTIYCKDLARIITYIQNDIINNLPESILKEININPVSYELAMSVLDAGDEQDNDTSDLLKSFKKDFLIFK